jgi:demethylmenaquinone methyltransferase / 2-methoxy-6-polyprenyl-1,4-benzoquinol methylase
LVKPYQNQEDSKKVQVEQMFDSISSEYDRLNRVISFGIDLKWRKKVVKMAFELAPDQVLDVATGTGDLVLAMRNCGASRIVGLDLSPGMLAVGTEKVKRAGADSLVEMVIGDSENLNFESETFDLITVAFGIRNFENLNKGLSEMLRVLKTGGTLIILETSVPSRFPFKQLYLFHSNLILPLIGKLFSKNQSAYRYLGNSAQQFPYGEALNNILSEIGFKNAKANPQTFGVATIYSAQK